MTATPPPPTGSSSSTAATDLVALGDVVTVTGTGGEIRGPDPDLRHRTATSARAARGTVAADRRHPADDERHGVRDATRGCSCGCRRTLIVTEHFQLGRFGEVLVSSDGRPARQPTNVVEPGAAAIALQAAERPQPAARRRRDRTRQNPDPIVFGRGGQPLSASNTLRGGDTITERHRRPDLHVGRQRGEPERLPGAPGERSGESVRLRAANPRPTDARGRRRRRARRRHEPAQLLQHLRRAADIRTPAASAPRGR